MSTARSKREWYPEPEPGFVPQVEFVVFLYSPEGKLAFAALCRGPQDLDKDSCVHHAIKDAMAEGSHRTNRFRTFGPISPAVFRLLGSSLGLWDSDDEVLDDNHAPVFLYRGERYCGDDVCTDLWSRIWDGFDLIHAIRREA